MYDPIDKKYYRTFVWKGKMHKEECINHLYAWSGQIPCTGCLKCVFSGKINEPHPRAVTQPSS